VKKLYYTCPVEAAYMAKNFGVRFTDNDLNHYAEDWKWEAFFNYFSTCMDSDDAVINDDSFSIFEQKENDITIMPNTERTMLVTNVITKNKQQEDRLKYIRSWHIIFRDGKPFIMPEVQK